MIELDLLDKKIINYLNSNIRATYSQIAKNVRSSKEVVNYRIKRLEDNNVIKGYVTIFEFGYFSYKLLINFLGVNKDEENFILNYLKQNPNINWLTTCTGPYDLVFAIMAKTPHDFDIKLRKVLGNIGEYIQEYKIGTSVFSKTFGHTYIIDSISSVKESKTKKIPNLKFDKKDKKIAKVLKTNARTRLVDICEKTKIPVDTIKYRIKKMQERGIIKRYRLLLDCYKLDFHRYEIFIRCSDHSKKLLDKFEEYSRVKPAVEYFCRCVGDWDIEFTTYFKTSQDLRKFVLDIKKEFGDYIKRLETVILFETYNFIYKPKELRDSKKSN